MRFPVPSTSLDLKRKRNPITLRHLQQDMETLQRPDCSLLPLLEFITFPHQIIHFKTLPSVCQCEMRREVLKMAEEIMIHQTRICNINRERRVILSKEVGFDVEMPMSLVDVFSAVDTHQYPLLWREFIKENTVIPTTVSCEQSFSVIKRTMHINMNPDTYIGNTTNKLHERAIPKLN